MDKPRKFYVGIPVMIADSGGREGINPVGDDDAPGTVQEAKILRVGVTAISANHAAHIMWERLDAALGDP